MQNFQTQVLTLAKQLGDPYGQEVDTVDYIATELQVSIEEVFGVFEELLNPAD
jgi:energy-converting hydrogenase A subunit M